VLAELFFFDLADPNAGWGAVAMPTHVCYNGLAAFQDQIYVIGGSVPNDPDHADRPPVAAVWVYDIGTQVWASAPPLPAPRMQNVAGVLGGRVWSVGGSDLAGNNTCETWSYAPGESEWRVEAPAPLPTAQCCACVIRDTMYISGNFAAAPKGVGGPPPPLAATLLALDGSGAAGGSGGGGGSWKVLQPDHPTAPKAPLVGAHRGEVWVVGGVKQASVHVFTPGRLGGAPGRWRCEESAPLPTHQSWGAAWAVGSELWAVGGAHFDARAASYVFDDRVFTLRTSG
jgi:hypothetical protein